jgi:hypothetical protein
MSEYNRNTNNSFDPSWWLIVIAFAVFWPVGVGLLLYKLSQSSQGKAMQRSVLNALEGQQRQQGYQPPQHRQTYQATGRSSSTTRPGAQNQPSQQSQPNKPNKPKRRSAAGIKNGRWMSILGGILTVLFGMMTVDEFMTWMPRIWLAIQNTLPFFVLTGVGVGLFAWGRFRRRQSRRLHKILNMVGEQKKVDIRALADAIPTDFDRACEDIQTLIDGGFLGENAYIDMSTGLLMLSGDGLKAKPKPKATPKQNLDEDEKLLAQIRQVNAAIPDEEMSRKIDRIEECTQHILEYQKNHPEKSPELHTFLDYYLPTTLKILNTYAELEQQGLDGENVMATKGRIEHMMDSVVEGFETQLDKLFQGDMMDISSDIDVMEKMLSRDGLSGGMKIPTAPDLPGDGEAAPAAQPNPAPQSDPFAQADDIFQSEAQTGYTPTLTLNPDGGAAAVQTAPDEEAKS